MKRGMYVAMPVGLALLVIGSGWMALAPRVLSGGYQATLVLGLIVTAIGAWGRREMLATQARGKSVKYGANALLSVLILISIVLLVNFASARFHKRWDLTRFGTFSLSPVTQRALDSIDVDIDVYAFFPESQRMEFRAVSELYEAFEYEQPRLKVYVVDPNKRNDLVEKLGVRGVTGTTIVTLHDGEDGRMVAFPGYDEAALTSALLDISRTSKKTVYWVKGHDERRPDERGGNGYNALIRDLRKQFFTIGELGVLPDDGRVPEDAAVVVFADPRSPLLPHEVEAYDAFLREGGRIVALTDYNPGEDAAGHPLQPLLERWGVRSVAGTVVDPRMLTGEKDFRVAIGDEVNRQHKAVEGLEGQRPVFRRARPLEFFEVQDDRQIFHEWLIQPGPGQRVDDQPYVIRGEMGTDAITEVDPQQQQSWAGRRISLILCAYRKFEPPEGSGMAGHVGRMVVTGDADFLSDRDYQGPNAELALNLFRWLGDTEVLIPKKGDSTLRLAKSSMQVTPDRFNFVTGMVVLLPVAIFLVGWIVWFARRSK